MSATMRVIEIREPGGPDVLALGERERPVPGDGQILVEVAYAGVNGPDMMQRKGLYPPPKGASDLLGLEIAGTVIETGAAVTRWKAGDRVCGLANGGGYAERCVLEEGQALPIPGSLSLAGAASLPETFFTIWSNVFMNAGLAADEVFLVHGGAGGLGTTCIQLGKAFGATVVATDSPVGRCGICGTLGADRVIDYEEEDFVDVVRSEFGGADVILDIVGGPYIARNIKAARHDGRIIQLAFALGSRVEINLMPVMLKRLLYTGSTLRSRSDVQKTAIAAELRDKVWPLIADGTIRPVVSTVLPLARAGEAHALMESAGHTGKIVLQVNG